jgi:putative endonuclease
MDKSHFVYIMANTNNGALYIGDTSDLTGRVSQHKQGIIPGFSKNYKTHTLVYFRNAGEKQVALHYKKQLKHRQRKWKLSLIEKHNPEWKDLWEEIVR